jgi:Ser/Thr protein kinase RdoA (MazF antagonist)
MSSELPFEALSPDRVLDAVESVGVVCDGRLSALNSYENRVFQVGIEDATPIIAKFYRPVRWSDAAILEEHAFSQELAGREIPVVAPSIHRGATLHHHQDFRFALFPRRGGHAPELDDPEHRLWLGRFLGRIHAVGEVRAFEHRGRFSIERFGVEPSRYLLENGWIPDYLEEAYRSLIDDLLVRIRARFDDAGSYREIRLHGDCHPGNILWRDGPHFVDLDDSLMGPAVQDLWMLLSGPRSEQTVQLSDIIEGYDEFCEFSPRELHLVEPLRTLRMIHYAGWVARRWQDPAFPQAFTWFDTPRFWEEHVLALREQAALLDEPPLVV